MPILQAERDNLPRWNGSQKGFYEVYTLKWNDPKEKVAVWLRYSFLSPLTRGPEASLSAIFFDAQDPKNNRVVKEIVPIGETRIDHEIFYCQVKNSAIYHSGTRGSIQSATDRMQWELRIHEPSHSLRHLPRLLYQLPYPRAKILAPHLACRVSGEFVMNGRRFHLESLPGHQAHHWGTEQPLTWIWGNCNSFREDASAVFEGITAPIALGKKALRPLTLFYLRYRGKDYSFLSPIDWFQNRSHYESGRWHFEAIRGDLRFVGDLSTAPDQWIRLRLENPDGSFRFCHHTEVADLKLEIFEKKQTWQRAETLTAEKSAALEVVLPHPGEACNQPPRGLEASLHAE